jgi:hypothetical protein
MPISCWGSIFSVRSGFGFGISSIAIGIVPYLSNRSRVFSGAERDRVIEQAIPPLGCASYKKRATARHSLDFLPEFFGLPAAISPGRGRSDLVRQEFASDAIHHPPFPSCSTALRPSNCPSAWRIDA